MSASVLSRRTILGATAVLGLAALPAISEAGTPVTLAADPDAGLLDLIARHAETDEALCCAEDEVDRLFVLANEAYPPRPAALRWKPDDFPRTSYGIGASDPSEDDGVCHYGRRGVEWLRRLDPPACWTEECERRRVEILTSFDAWMADCREVDRRVGLVAVEEAREDANKTLAALTDAILVTAPRTFTGLAAKVTWAAPEDMPDNAVAGQLRRVMADVVAMAELDGVRI